MAGFRRTRYLSCFYCGRRTSIRYDGSLQQFDCPHCEATNFLDRNGDITDPPVSKTGAAESPAAAAPVAPVFTQRDASLEETASDGVFCATCLKNQHLFIASLAQYYPPDPDHPEYAELERRYFRFRQNLEHRYPQVCADCEPAVLERIRQAGYTAKTDHLRRMVHYSRQVQLARPTYLDLVNRLGRWLWWSALVFQALWHLGALSLASQTSSQALGDADVGFGDDTIVSDTFSDHRQLPATSLSPLLFPQPLQPLLVWTAVHVDRLQSLCIGATLASCWWNPFFVQTVRGFTKPLLGISAWYAYQAALVCVRAVLAKMTVSSAGAGAGADMAAVLGLHAFSALFALYVHIKAPRCIRKDLRPLFGKLPTAPLVGAPALPSPLARQQAQKAEQQAEQRAEQRADNRRRGLETMADVLDEISMEATPSPAFRYGTKQLQPQQQQQQTQLPRFQHPENSPPRLDGWTTDSWQSPQRGPTAGRTGSDNPFSRTPNAHRRMKSDFELGSLQIKDDDDDDDNGNDNDPRYQIGLDRRGSPFAKDSYSDEMDWTPSQPAEPVLSSPYRAFQTYSPATPLKQGDASSFGQTPIEPNRGPFWYKVPPAPTSIAQRVLSPLNRPRLRTQSNRHGDIGSTVSASPAAASSSFFGPERRTLDFKTATSSGGGRDSGGASFVEFSQPRFFASSLTGREDETGNSLSDMFSQAFSLNAADGEQSVPGGSALQKHNRSTGDNARSRRPAMLAGRVVWGGVLALSFQLVRKLRLGGAPDVEAAGWYGASVAGPATAKVVETAAVGLCAVTAALLTRESVRRWQRVQEVKQEQRRKIHQQQKRASGGVVVAAVPSLWPEAVGLLLGLASLALAGWMAVQLNGGYDASGSKVDVVLSRQDMDAIENVEGVEVVERVKQSAEAAISAMPWQWWQLAALHTCTLGHYLWNMVRA